jgi:hypothetical protein
MRRGAHHSLFVDKYQFSHGAVTGATEPPGDLFRRSGAIDTVRQKCGAHQITEMNPRHLFANCNYLAGAVRQWHKRRLDRDMVVASRDRQIAEVQGNSLDPNDDIVRSRRWILAFFEDESKPMRSLYVYASNARTSD